MPEHLLVLSVANTGEVQKNIKAQMRILMRWLTPVNVPNWIFNLFLKILVRQIGKMLQVLIYILWNDVEIETLCRLRFLEHELRQTLWRSISEPLFDRQSIANRFRNFLALLIQKELICKAYRRMTAKDAANLTGQLDRID